MKKMYKYAIALFCAIALLESCCKKEKCPKLSDEIKNILPHYNGEVRQFICFNIQTNKIDTIDVKIYKYEVNKNTPCSYKKEIAGKCQSYVQFNFLFETYLTGGVKKFVSNLFFHEKNNSIQSNFKYSDKLQSPFLVNGKYYSNVMVDSIETPNDLSDPRETVLYYTTKEGLLMARSYLNDTLTLQISKIN